MNARISATVRELGRELALLLALTAPTVALAALLLSPSRHELLLLALFLPISGGVSLLLARGFLTFYGGRLLWGLRGRLLATTLIAAGLVLINVGFTGYLMFLSAHDLKLMSLLMLFALGIAAYFALVVSQSFHSTLQVLLDGVRRLGDSALATRIEVSSRDELEDVANAFNAMALRLQEAADQQSEMEAARRQLIAAVSHDLRTPLATMRAMIESINDGVVSDADTVQRYHTTMQAEIEYLSRLIDDLFELSQIDSGSLELRLEPSSIADLISDTLEALGPQAQQRHLRLYGEVDDYLPSVQIDVVRMQRVLYNLVQNSLRHTPPDGSVCVRATQQGAVVAVSVEDSGEGLEPEEIPHVFERFYRGNKARTRDTAGSGLGLTIAKGIVELHGGSISVTSRRDQGASFTFTVPK